MALRVTVQGMHAVRYLLVAIALVSLVHYVLVANALALPVQDELVAVALDPQRNCARCTSAKAPAALS